MLKKLAIVLVFVSSCGQMGTTADADAFIQEKCSIMVDVGSRCLEIPKIVFEAVVDCSEYTAENICELVEKYKDPLSRWGLRYRGPQFNLENAEECLDYLQSKSCEELMEGRAPFVCSYICEDIPPTN